MYDISMEVMSEAFARCWNAAGVHLQAQVQDGIKSWLRAHPFPPFFEHISFRLGNQLFFIRVEDVDGRVEGPSTREGLAYVAKVAGGHACLLPMRQQRNGTWAAVLPAWGLIELHTHVPLDPVALITSQRIEMSHWELQDFGVQVVRDSLKQKGYRLMSWQGNPDIDPALWFVGRSGGPEWVVVRVVRYPIPQAECPSNWPAIAQGCDHIGRIGHFASVAVKSAAQANNVPGAPTLPLWRGYGMEVAFDGLVPVTGA